MRRLLPNRSVKLASKRTFALLGSEFLLGRELRDLVGAGDYPFDLRLIAAAPTEAGKLTSLGDEAAIAGALDAESLAGVAGLLLAASPDVCRKAAELAEDGTPAIDLIFAAEDSSDARLRAPSVEPPGFKPSPAGVQVVAHPAAIALAMLLRRLQTLSAVRRSLVQVFVPASERGTPGLEELQQQGLNLFAFKPLPKVVFDTQIAFNMLARYGEESKVALEETELRIERHLATLLSFSGAGAGVPMPSIKLAQAPVFHGYSFSLWVEFERNPGAAALEKALAGPGIDVRDASLEPPTNVGQAGQGGISVGAISVDRNCAQACWLWMVADNLRLAAENALELARELV
jgi:aspartate-semialdehyde dehydrogenase